MTEALKKMIDGKKEERVFLAEHSFLLFALYYFQNYFHYPIADYHKEFGKDVHDLLDGKIRECAWIAFRESGKTSFAKMAICYMIAFKKKGYINVDSADKENAERILFDVVYELTNNKRLLADFNTLYSKKKAPDEIKQTRINNFVTENGIRVEAHSTQESVRGRVHRDQRPDFMLLDDFETNKTKASKAYTKQIRDHITEAMSGMSPDGCILYLGNYITEYGNVQYLMDRAVEDDKIRIRNIPVIENDEPTWPAKYCMTDQESDVTGLVSLEDKRRQLGSYVFSYEMMNQPIDDTQAEFKAQYVQHATPEQVKMKNTLCFVTIDGAVSKKDSADYTGITVNWVSEDNKWFIYTYRMKINSRELIDHIFYIHQTYKPEIIGMEATAFTLAIEPFLKEEMAKKNTFFTVRPLKHKGTNKEARIRALIPRWENGGMFLVGENLDLKDEMRTFPQGMNDDVLDSVAYQLEIARRPSQPYLRGYQSGKPSKKGNPAV